MQQQAKDTTMKVITLALISLLFLAFASEDTDWEQALSDNSTEAQDDIGDLSTNAIGQDNLYGCSTNRNDHQTLKVVEIGTQVWMDDNLSVGHYRNGDPIPQVQDQDKWNSVTYGAWCYINNDPEYGRMYGKLYNWYAVNDPRGLAPEGWGVPTDKEWKILENYLGMSQVDADNTGKRGTDQGDKLKSRSGWVDNGNGNNSSGFNAPPGGWRRSSNGSFGPVGGSTYIWTSSEHSSSAAWVRALYFNGAYISRGSLPKQGGYSVRLIRDRPTCQCGSNGGGSTR